MFDSRSSLFIMVYTLAVYWIYLLDPPTHDNKWEGIKKYHHEASIWLTVYAYAHTYIVIIINTFHSNNICFSLYGWYNTSLYIGLYHQEYKTDSLKSKSLYITLFIFDIEKNIQLSYFNLFIFSKWTHIIASLFSWQNSIKQLSFNLRYII